MTDIEYQVSDLLNFSSKQQPMEFQKAFNAIITDKISQAIDHKKIEYAQQMFAPADGEAHV